MLKNNTVERRIKPGDIVLHFKGKRYKVLNIAEHVDGGKLVIYMSLYEPYKIWARDYEEFNSEVDTNKYPEVSQRYRFEVMAEEEV